MDQSGLFQQKDNFYLNSTLVSMLTTVDLRIDFDDFQQGRQKTQYSSIKDFPRL
ncbi:hypothetical protein PL9214650799 [Planktothrix tepida PCC 9214]|uniref:Uncharacterized protein n=1 Tax=Planktothrix tepida PCC 9214 TaxID=671072 RepID=A0A1J1LRX8_9CYAN|nr:hypothetical protein PL9214650799 [Planktothrix tepida PCC 9214]